MVDLVAFFLVLNFGVRPIWLLILCYSGGVEQVQVMRYVGFMARSDMLYPNFSAMLLCAVL